MVTQSGSRVDDNPSQELDEMLLSQPSHFLKCSPQLRCLVYINFAGLLTIRLPELFANLQALNSCNEDATLAGEVGGAVEAEVSSKSDFVLVEKMSEGIRAKINWGSSPFNFQGVWSIRK